MRVLGSPPLRKCFRLSLQDLGGLLRLVLKQPQKQKQPYNRVVPGPRVLIYCLVRRNKW